ncbi:MAG: hypothetical protein V4683_18935 [Bacteroidota bacterium]
MKNITTIFVFAFFYTVQSFGQATWSSNSDSSATLKLNEKLKVMNVLETDKISVGSTSIGIIKSPFFISFINLNSILKIKINDKVLQIDIQSFGVDIKKNDSPRIALAIDTTQDATHNNNNNIINKEPKTDSYNIFEEALSLKGAVSLNDTMRLNQILQKYGAKEDNILLPKLIQTNHIKPNEDDPSGALHGVNISNKIGGLDVTKYADGLAKFIVGRVKNELAISFFNEFTQKLNDKNVRDASVLFKNTFEELNLIGTKIYNYNTYLPVIKQNFKDDLEKLPLSIESLIEDDSSQISGQLSKIKNARYITNLSFDFVNQLDNEVFVGDALENLAITDNEILKNTDSTLVGAFKSVQLFSMALRNNASSKDHYWLEKAKIKSLLTDSLHFRYFMGLVAQVAKNKNISFGKQSLFSTINAHANNLAQFSSLVNTIGRVTSRINEIKSSVKSKDSTGRKVELFLSYLESATNLMGMVKEIKQIVKDTPQNSSIDKFINISQSITSIYKNHVQKRYSNELLYFGELLTEINSKDNKLIDLINFISTKGQFIAQMAEAENSDEVNQILENFAAPVGSWRDKRSTKLNVAIDSYLGPSYFMTRANKWGLSTPLGVSFTFPLNKYQLSLMPSFIDIGPLTANRFGNEESSIEKIYLREILSPGIFISFNFGKNFPLTLNFGHQQMPLLEKVGSTNTIAINKKWATSASINVNVPIFTVVNKKSQ